MILISVLFVSLCFLTQSNCTQYNPSLYPSYDVLNPGQEVLANPVRITDDGYFVVNGAYIQWVDELQAEIVRLRKAL